MKNIVVLISGNGSNLQAIIDACARKKINGTLRAVFSNKADAFGLFILRSTSQEIPFKLDVYTAQFYFVRVSRCCKGALWIFQL